MSPIRTEKSDSSTVDLANGMSVTARVEYDKLTYFEYVMEALGVLFR